MSVCLVYCVVFLALSMLSFFSSLNFMSLDSMIILEIEMVSINSSSVVMSILLDWMSLLFASFVLFISSMVIFYSHEYMGGDLMMNRFILLVVMFVASMLLLIFSPNLISILLGWDGLGLVSYCLVIYYQNVKSYNAGMITALTNRLGDVAFLMSIAWMFNFGSWNYLFFLDIMNNSVEMDIIMFLMLLAGMTKSAQIPFSSWLPAAMAAPTPVSSLVHSSTLVTAGVYLLIRFNFCMGESVKMILLFVASLTMFMAGLGASYEFDLKKIIALSTLSQLGLMMSILAMGGYILSFYHLLTHALFKALLFMCAGAMIHNLSNCQDIRFMGGIINQMPLTCTFFVICNMSLCGLPFLSGFYSKDLILEYVSMGGIGFYIYLIYFLSTGLTVAYTFRLIYYVLSGNFNHFCLSGLGDSSSEMLKGMMGIILFVVFMGSGLSWMILSTPYFICLSFTMKMMTLIVTVAGGWIGNELAQLALSWKSKSLNFVGSSMFFGSMWNMPYISTFGVNFYFLHEGEKIYSLVDQGWSEYFGSQNFYLTLSVWSKFFQIFHSNNLKIFLSLTAMMIVFLVLMIF
uniref:NADH-ubiquinone oxidoreductase chain 5 n=1 Tax=Dorcus linwenhsini TaxID=3074305 RepID=A0AA51YN14_9SCAR|nr:NADH dehydrogenase subunit 5 [Dorcus linwenhsini]WMW30098.1 NADH dehydrogenase subunit 5 [Dorcus linwenhsini]